MKDAVMKQLRLLEQSVIHEKIAGFILPVPIKDRMKPGGRLWKENAGFLYIAGISGSLFPISRIYAVGYTFVNGLIFFRQIIVILIIRIKIFQGAFIQV